MKRLAIFRNLLIALVLIQSLLLTIICVRTTGGWDEWAHLPSGLYNLKYNDPYAYRVNPPLVRLIAALPVRLLGGELRQPQVPRGDPGMRIEWALMKAYVAEQGPRVFDWLTIARFSVLPISILGSLLIHSIAKHFSGPRTALLAATLFVFSPMMLTCGASIAPDLGATVFGLFASWRSYVWMQTGRWNHAIWSGFAIGTALGSKTTWILFPVLLAVFFVSSQVGFNHHLRYVLPAFPAAYLIASYPLGRVSKPVQCVMMGLTFWFCVSSLSLLPRSYGFFREAIGGWRNGHKYLNSSNLDWGQDLLTIRNWVTENSEKRPVYILHPIPQLSLDDLKIDASGGHGLVGRNGPSAPGWWLVSIDQCLAKPYSWFLEQTPTERLSVSTTVYHVVDGQIVTAESSEAYEAAQ